MVDLLAPRGAGVANALIPKFKYLGMDRDEELQALLLLVKGEGRVSRGEDIVRVGSSPRYLTVLLTGVACRYKMMENGRRQIFTFQYPGDVCDIYRFALPELDDAVSALTDSLIGVIFLEDIERISRQYPKLGLALWRDTMLEASIFRERLLNVGQRHALPRTANLLCEQMVRLEAIGMNGAVIPLTQVDLADAAGLSVVHMNRTIQDLRELGALLKNSRTIKVVNRDRLMDIAKFDGRYLNMNMLKLLSHGEAPRLDYSRGRALPGHSRSDQPRQPLAGERAVLRVGRRTKTSPFLTG
jgi:CRP-like cAMP-binding protein